MAVADGELTVPQHHIFSRSPVLSDLNHRALHHGQHLVTPRVQVYAVVELPLSGKWVRPVPVWRIDLHFTERIAHAQIALHPFLLSGFA